MNNDTDPDPSLASAGAMKVWGVECQGTTKIFSNGVDTGRIAKWSVDKEGYSLFIVRAATEREALEMAQLSVGDHQLYSEDWKIEEIKRDGNAEVITTAQYDNG